MDKLWKKLLLAVFVGLVIVGVAYVVCPVADRERLFLEAVKDLGVVVIGIAAVEVVWAWAGGSPVDLDLRALVRSSADLNNEVKVSVHSIADTSNEIRITSQRIETAVENMTTIVKSSGRVGLSNVGARQDELGYTPTELANRIMNSRVAVDLCGCQLGVVYANDGVVDALVSAANREIPVRMMLTAPKGPVAMAIFNDRFENDVRHGAAALTEVILGKSSKITLYHLSKKALTLSVLRIDDTMLVMPYMYSPQTTESPRFEVTGAANSLFKSYMNEFNELLKIAELVSK